jgi:acyl-CoA synthetase (AMP-forming)/AMP-acid ligase II
MFDAPRPLLPEILALHGRWRATKPFVIAEEQTVSWGDFARRTACVANGLSAMGVLPGERVGLLMDARIETLEAIWGVMRAGGVVAPLNLAVTDASARAMLADAEVSALVATPDQAARLDAVTTGAASLTPERILVVGGAPGFTDFAAWRDAQTATAPALALDDEAICNIIYSSGTTGEPKGIVHTHRRRLDWTYDIALALRYHAGARTLINIGLYSNITWVAMLSSILCGATLVLHARFDAGQTLAAIAGGATHLAMAPVQYQRLLAHPSYSASDKSRVQAMMCCGSPLPVSVKERLLKDFPCGVIELYGMTEGIITTLDPEDAPEHLTSVGRPLPGTDIIILGCDDCAVPPGQPGEIVGRGRITMPGYWRRPDATRDATWTDGQGRAWLRTGDIGRIDEDGFLTILDRKKDMILSGGQNVYPADIEAVLQTHPDVAECAVIGAPDETWGETPLAVIVARPQAQSTGLEVRDWLNARLGKRERVREVRLVGALPRNPNGKVLKRVLRDELLLDADLRAPSLPARDG